MFYLGTVVSSSSFLNACMAFCRQLDKQKHFMISCLLLVAFVALGLDYIRSFAIVFAIGLAKEVWDHFKGSGFCWLDMLANFLGMVVGLILLAIYSTWL